MSRVGLGAPPLWSERVKWNVPVMAGSHSTSCGVMRSCGLRDLPVREVPCVPHPMKVIVNVRGLLEREHEAVDQSGSYADYQ